MTFRMHSVFVVLALLLTVLPLDDLKADHKFNPGPVGTIPWGRNVRRPRISRASSHYSSGPQYSAPKNDQPPDQPQVQQILRDQRNGSPMDMAATGLMGTPPSNNQDQIKAQFQGLIAQLWAIYYQWLAYYNNYDAQWNALFNKSNSDFNAYLASYQGSPCYCYTNPGALTAYYNERAQMDKLSNDETAYTQQLQAKAMLLVPQLMALAAQIQSSPGTQPSAPLAIPPNFNMDMIAQKFNFNFPDSGGASGGYEDGEAFSQLEEMAADHDGGGDGRSDFDNAPNRSLRHYDRLNIATQVYSGQLERMSDLGTAAAEKANRGDKKAAADLEYYQMNYNQLGAKYQDLAAQQTRQATQAAREVLQETDALPTGPHIRVADVPAPNNDDAAAMAARSGDPLWMIRTQMYLQPADEVLANGVGAINAWADNNIAPGIIAAEVGILPMGGSARAAFNVGGAWADGQNDAESKAKLSEHVADLALEMGKEFLIHGAGDLYGIQKFKDANSIGLDEEGAIAKHFIKKNSEELIHFFDNLDHASEPIFKASQSGGEN